MREEELKNKITEHYFSDFDATKIIGNIDFAVAAKNEKLKKTLYLLWAEAKKGNANIENSISQLVLTIGKAKTYTKHLPPKFVGCFDEKKIALIPYYEIQNIFYRNDFNWNITPSDYKTKEFNIVLEEVKTALQEKESYIFDFQKQDSELKIFIKENFLKSGNTTKIEIEKHNFRYIYDQWLEKVKPTIAVNWEKAEKNNILDCSFYLADLLSKDNTTVEQNLLVLLENDHYIILDRKINQKGFFNEKKTSFKDKQKAHKEFWNIYQRPPQEKYWDTLIQDTYNLKPKDFKEQEGAFFTPNIWVKKSQEYLEKVLGKNWQNEYYIWDCACGTGNLLKGLRNKYNIFASDIDRENINNLHSRIKNGDVDLLENHCFTFDFLNDSFEKLPEDSRHTLTVFFDKLLRRLQILFENVKNEDLDTLPEKLHSSIHRSSDKFFQEARKVFREILKNDFNKLPEKLHDIIKNEPEKLLIYINPPYAEAGNQNKISKGGKKNLQKTYVHKYFENLGMAGRQLFAQFLIRIYLEIPNCKIANFSTLSILAGNGFKEFREIFTPQLKSLFLIPAYTFESVIGKFPIGFFIWDANKKEIFKKIKADVFEVKMKQVKAQQVKHMELKEFKIINKTTKNIHSYDNQTPISHWIDISESEDSIGYLTGSSYNSFQHNNLVRVYTNIESAHSNPAGRYINANNLLKIAIHFAVRKCIPHTWLNHDDRFLYPKKKWQKDKEFQQDCLAYMLFHPSNNVKSEEGVEGKNHWIPFREWTVEAQENFKSNFLCEFMEAKIKMKKENHLLGEEKENFIPTTPLIFSKEAKAVFEAGKELWKYYHSQNNANVNASFYDIRGYFQGFKNLQNGKKRMNARSADLRYTELLKNLKDKMQILGNKIAPKIYEYGFLLK